MYVKAFVEFASEMKTGSVLKQFCIIDMKDEILKMVDQFYHRGYVKDVPITAKGVLALYSIKPIDPNVGSPKNEQSSSSTLTSTARATSLAKFLLTGSLPHWWYHWSIRAATIYSRLQRRLAKGKRCQRHCLSRE